jgi:hypothetical protein
MTAIEKVLTEYLATATRAAALDEQIAALSQQRDEALKDRDRQCHELGRLFPRKEERYVLVINGHTLIIGTHYDARDAVNVREAAPLPTPAPDQATAPAECRHCCGTGVNPDDGDEGDCPACCGSGLAPSDVLPDGTHAVEITADEVPGGAAAEKVEDMAF